MCGSENTVHTAQLRTAPSPASGAFCLMEWSPCGVAVVSPQTQLGIAVGITPGPGTGSAALLATRQYVPQLG